ncbi:PIG-L deacetylase family protein [Chloroflexota bacterium]
MTEQAYALVTIPHPDDAELRMAGAVARWTREGKDVIYVICTNGDKGSSDPDTIPEELARIREQEQLAAAEILGLREVIFLRYPDQNLENTPELRKELVRLIRTYKPEIVVTVDHSSFYIHRDHRITTQVTMDAVFPIAGTIAYTDLLEQGLYPHKVKEILFCGSENPNYFIDITDTIDLKIAALRCHESQVGDRPQFGEMVRERAKMSAQGQDYKFAEGFYREVIPWQDYEHL